MTQFFDIFVQYMSGLGQRTHTACLLGLSVHFEIWKARHCHHSPSIVFFKSSVHLVSDKYEDRVTPKQKPGAVMSWCCQILTHGVVLKSYTKYPLYSHQNSLPRLIYIIPINPTCTHRQHEKKKERKKNSLKWESASLQLWRLWTKNISGDH